MTYAEFLQDSLNRAITYSLIYPDDGVVLSFQSKSNLYLSQEEVQEVKAIENVVITVLQKWIKDNPGKTLIYHGMPYFITGNSMLELATFIILPTIDAKSKSNLSLLLSEGKLATDMGRKIIVSANLPSYLEEESALGYFKDGSLSSIGTAEWTKSLYLTGEVQGIALFNLRYDYFNMLKSFKHTRSVIDILNPSVKK